MRAWIRRDLTLGALSVVFLAASAAAEPTGDTATAAYRDLLEHYANGQEGEALRRLMGLEFDLVGLGHDLEQIRKLELGLVEDQLPLHARPVLPVIVLHEAAYLAYRAEGSSAFAFHSRTTMVILSELFADRAITTAERRLAGDLFASLGGYFQESSVSSTGMKLFARSLEIDRNNKAALLGAAVASEQRGRYSKALGFLERLVRAHPGNVEGRLRLAINLGRAERATEAIALLRQLLEMETPQWICSLTHQALARLLIDTQRIADAKTVLLDGVERFPDDPTLPIALAYAKERQAGGRGNFDLHVAPQPSPGSPGTPPRFRYSRDPLELFEHVRAQLRRTSHESRSALARALSGQRPTPGD